MERPDGKQSKKPEFCSCKNSCQKGTGPKRVGCPCKDKEVYCSDQCKCGTNRTPCKNNALCCIQPDDQSKQPTPLPPKPNPKPPPDENDGKKGPITDSLLRQVHQINNGYALVFHNHTFYNLRKRQGSEKDIDAIRTFCKETSLMIDVQENVTVEHIRAYCKKITKDENIFQDYDALVCFILSHGNSSGVHGVDDDHEPISVEEIVSFFKETDELLGKPKLFFIQACRGQVEDDSTAARDPQNRLCPPDSSDTLIAHSTIKGELSFRDTRNGSWFIQTLMRYIRKHGQGVHLMDIMTAVNDDIAGSDLEGYRQMPIQVTTLTKFVYFKMTTIPKDDKQ